MMQTTLTRPKRATLGKDAHKLAKSTKSEKYGAYRRLAYGQKILFDNDVKAPQSGNIHRTRLCQSARHRMAESISLNISSDPKQEKASLSGVQTCSNPWGCPVCAPRIASQRGKEISYTNKAMLKMGHVPIMLTLTARHNLESPLLWHKEKFKLAWNKLQRDGSFKRLLKKLGIKHRIKSVEVTWGSINGWHYHMHLLLYAHADALKALSVDELENWIDKLKKRWLACLDAVGLDGDYEHALNVKADGNVKAAYLAKLGLTGETTNTNFELSAGHNKGYKGRNIWSILRKASEGDEHSEALYLEYVKAMTGDKWITWSNDLKDLVGLDEMPEEEAAKQEDAPETMEHLMDISDSEYLPVRKMRAYAELLEVAAISRSEEIVRQWLVSLMKEYEVTQKPENDARMLRQYEALERKLNMFRKTYDYEAWQAGSKKKDFMEDFPVWHAETIRKWNQLREQLQIR